MHLVEPLILSLSHRFIFIHTGKTAGTSIQAALRSFAHEPEGGRMNRLLNRIGLQQDYRKIRFSEHLTADRLRRKLPAQVFDNSFKFAFVRNPWDWLVSLYHYLQETPSHRHHRRVRAASGFEEYVEFEIARNKRSQLEFLVDSRGEFLLDYIGRFENLAEDFAEICEHLQVSVELPHINRSQHEDYRSYYTDATRKRVADHWGEEIRRLSYNFENRDLRPVLNPPA